VDVNRSFLNEPKRKNSIRLSIIKKYHKLSKSRSKESHRHSSSMGYKK